MKLLLDENISPRIAGQLGDLYPGSISVLGQGWGGRSDLDLLLYAATHGFIVVSHDADFQELALIQPKSPKIVLLRLGNLSTAATERVLRNFHEQIEAFAQDPDRQVMELR